MSVDKKLTEELNSFSSLWENGYFEGDPLNPMARSTYGQLGFISTLHATFLRCIKPYVNDNTIAIEIGPGRGAWTKTLLPAKEIYALDALSAEHNKFFEYLGHPKNVQYFQVKDFGCEMLPDNHFNYIFSYGALCHISFAGIKNYAVNIYPKLVPGSHCFWMVADYEKYNQALENLEKLSVWNAVIPNSQKNRPLKLLGQYLIRRNKLKMKRDDDNDEPSPGRWYNAGVARTCSMLEQVGYQIVDPDVGTCLRDPIIHFMKT